LASGFSGWQTRVIHQIMNFVVTRSNSILK
jgi:hypothetical protein